MYDPTLGRFLSADPIIQHPDSTQGLNRYSYVDNNPLSLTDPTGMFLGKIFKAIGNAFKSLFKAIGNLFKNPYVRLALGVAAGFYGGIGFAKALGYAAESVAYHVAAGIAGGFIAGGIIGGNLESAFMGALTGGVFGAIGGYTQGMVLSKQVAAHALAGGATARLQGGSFQSGMLSAGFAQWASPLVDQIKLTSSFLSRVGRSMTAAVIGGAASVIGGGKFANGAVTAAFARTFNDEVALRPNLAKPIADAALEDGRLSLSEANSIWRANNDTGFAVTVDASQLTVNQRTDFSAYGTAGGTVLGSDWFVHGSVTLNLDTLGNIFIRPGSYDFQPHGSFWNSPVRNFETYGGFYLGSRVGTSVGTDFLIKYSGRPNVIR